MPTFTWPVPANLVPKLSDETPDAVTDYLATQGIIATSVDIRGNPVRLVIAAATDPTTALNAYTGQPSAKRDQFEQAKQIANTYMQKVTSNQAVTAAETSKAVAALTLIVQRGGFGV
jgi:hypothetical protein